MTAEIAMARPRAPYDRHPGYEWVPEVEGEDWRIAAPNALCRQPKCRRPAAVELRRDRMVSWRTVPTRYEAYRALRRLAPGGVLL